MARNKVIEELLFSKTEKGYCVTCKKKVNMFSDDLSLKEYGISGMCQECQDSVFVGG